MSTFSQHFRSFSKGRARLTGVRSGGFTLIEMLVVTAIIMILTAVFLFQQSRFDSATILRGLAYSTALSIRQAQVYGVSVLGTGSGSATFAPAYGVYFSAGLPNQYTLFADQPPGNGVYDANAIPSEDVKVFTLGAKYTISKICARAASSWRCSTAGASSLQIIFKRPNPDAYFVFLDASGTPYAETYSSAYVQVKSSEGSFRDVWVNATGQISVQPPNVDPV